MGFRIWNEFGFGKRGFGCFNMVVLDVVILFMISEINETPGLRFY
jgi:hypothetical protein